MNKTLKNQKGFALVEGLLIILILAVIGFGGYYVWHSQHKTTTATTTATSSKKASASAQKTSDNATVKIPEMGVELTVPDTLSDITYNYSVNDPAGGTPLAGDTFADLSTDILDGIDSGCVANSSSDTAAGTALGSIVKGTGQGEKGEDFTILKQFNGYYIAYAEPQAACGSNSSNDGVVESELNTLLKALPNITVTAIN